MTITLRQQNEAMAIARNYLLGILDRFAANVLDDPLGNGGHFGIGVCAITQSPIYCLPLDWPVQEIYWQNRMSLEYLWPRWQRRFYIRQNNPEDFSSRDFYDPDQAADNLLFLQNEIIERVNLLAIKTNVTPGFILRFTSMLAYDDSHWSSRLGANLWVQKGEQISGKKLGPCTVTTQDQLNSLDMCKVRAPLALQLKIFGELTYSFQIGRDDKTVWTIGVNGDITALKRGIGRDYTIGFVVEASL
jgi:hypothetical protein